MDEMTMPSTDHLSERAGERVGEDVGDRSSRAEEQPALPFDDGVDEPIAYRLTARARRSVAPESLPSLAVVPGRADAVVASDGDLERPGDTRPARARALRRAGLTAADIAGQLAVDPFLVDVWVADVQAPSRRATPRATRRAPETVRPVAAVTPLVGRSREGRATATATATSAHHDEAAPPSGDAERTAAALARAEAAREGRERLAREPDLAAGVGLLAGLARTDDHAITITAATPALAAAAVRFATRHLGVAVTDVAVVVRLGPKVAGDLARHRWAAALEVSPSTVAHARWRGAPGDHAEEAILRIADPAAAATLAGWCDALLSPEEHDLDVAF
jgi:transposase-like protein